MSLKSEIEFCVKILNLLNNSSDKLSNIYAPPLILSSLAMVLAGSENATATEICNIIGEGQNQKEIIEYYSNFLEYCKLLNSKSYNDSPFHSIVYKLLISNKLFLSENKMFPEFKKIMVEKFDNQIEQVDFGNQEETAEKINKFVEEKTEGKINKIVENSDIEKDMNLFIINALCFKGQWLEPFNEPKLEKFYSSSKMSDFREIETIFREASCEKWNFTQGDGWECLGIPYETRQSWMHILLPNKNIELTDLINKLDYKLIQECIKKQPKGCVRATIPTFQIESDMDLEKILKTLGIFHAFEGEGINKIYEDDSHYINKAIHKAGIKERNLYLQQNKLFFVFRLIDMVHLDMLQVHLVLNLKLYLNQPYL